MNNEVLIKIRFCFILAQSNAKDEKPFSCKPNKPFKKDCNSCECSGNGKYAICSGYTCDPDNKSIELKPPKNCKVGDTWSDGCNKCSCESKWYEMLFIFNILINILFVEGNFACTQMRCSIMVGEKPAVMVPQKSMMKKTVKTWS